MFKFIKEIEGTFKLPKKRFYLGKEKYGCPYFFPINYSRFGLSIRTAKIDSKYSPTTEQLFSKTVYKDKETALKTFRVYSRSWKQWKFFLLKRLWVIEMGTPIHISTTRLGWKDKYDTPRLEWCPSFDIFFFGLQFKIIWDPPTGNGYNNDNYYEMVLWYLYYSDKNIYKARKTWPWFSGETKNSTWNEDNLIKKDIL
jgi:hypothetical protein